MKPKDWIAITLVGFLCGLLFPLLTDDADTPAPPTATTTRITLPESGIEEDTFTHLLLQAAMQAKPEGNILLTPNSLALLLSQLRELSTPELADKIQTLGIPTRAQESAAAPAETLCLFADISQQIATTHTFNIVPTPFSQDLPKAISTINNTVANLTQGAVQQMVNGDQVSEESGLVSVNTLLFHVPWLYPVHAADTKDGDFFNADGSLQHVRMMQCTGSFRVAEDPAGNWKAAALFFRDKISRAEKSEPCALVIVLPKNHSARKTAAKLTPAQLVELKTALALAPEVDGCIALPQLTFHGFAQDITPLMQQLGMDPLFTSANPLEKLGSESPLHFGRAFQCCRVVLAEDQAPSVPYPLSAEAYPLLLSIDSPFIWFISPLTSSAPPYAIGVIDNL